MTHPPVPKNEEGRLKALKNYNILDTLPEEEFDRLTRLVSIVCGTPTSLITLLDEDRQWFKSAVGFNSSETPRNLAFCNYTILGDSLLEVKDTRKDDRFVDNPLVTDDPSIRYYAGYPLIDPNGYALGALCAIDAKPNELNAEQRETLKLLAREVVSQIVARREKIRLKNYEKLFLESLDLITITGKDGFFRKINPAFRRTLGWTDEDMLSRPFYTFLHPDDVKPATEVMQGLARGENVQNFVSRFQTVAGAYKYFQWIATPDLENDNIYAIGRDITDFITIQDELMRASDFQEKILNGTHYAIVSTSRGGTVTTFNRGAEIMLGYQASEVVNRLNVVHFIDPKELVKVKKELSHSAAIPVKAGFEAFLSQSVHEGTNTSAWTLVQKDGSRITVELTISQLEGDGKEITGYLAVGKDITAKNAALTQLEISERRHRAFFENSQSLMCTHDLQGNFLSINPAGAEMMGYTFGEMTIRSLYDVVVPQFKDEVGTYLEEIRNRGSLKGLMQIQDKNGDIRTWMYNNVLSEFVEGRQYVIGNAVDLTNRIRMETELHHAKENAEKNARAKDIFLANMSHEIRTPMNAIIGFANLLKDTPMSRDQWEFTNSISTASENLMGIINDILDLSKIESGHLVIEKISFNLKELVRNVKAVQKQKAIEKGLGLEVALSENLPVFVIGDPTRLTQILLNLVNNALKFTEKGLVKLAVEMTRESEQTCVIQFVVSDTGIGIAKDKLSSIFERFTQADVDTTRRYGGTGLGLSISKLLIELQQGTLSVESQPNEGSTFYVTLPFENAAEKTGKQTGKTAPGLTSGTGLKVLLVEDNILNQRLATRVLENIGFEPDLAENGRVALDKLDKNQYDVVLMDLQMPEMDGYQATEFIRNELKNDVPIIAMTAHSLVGEKEKCLHVGMNDYLPKPFSPVNLFNKIMALVASASDKEVSEVPDSGTLVDLSYLRGMSGNSREFEQEMIDLFLVQVPAELVAMEEAIRQSEYETVSKIAHKLKSSYSMLGVQDNDLIKQIEAQGDSGVGMERIRGQYEQLGRITQAVIKELTTLMQKS